MRRIPTILVVAMMLSATLTSCTGSATATPDFAGKFIAAENKAWGTGDVQDLKALEDVDVIYHLPEAEVKGWDAHEKYILEGRKTVSDLRQDWKYLSGEKDHMILSYSSSAVVPGDANSPTAISNSYLFAFRLENGKIKEVWANGSTTSKPVESKSAR
jgi:hypothetical protein